MYSGMHIITASDAPIAFLKSSTSFAQGAVSPSALKGEVCPDFRILRMTYFQKDYSTDQVV